MGDGCGSIGRTRRNRRPVAARTHQADETAALAVWITDVDRCTDSLERSTADAVGPSLAPGASVVARSTFYAVRRLSRDPSALKARPTVSASPHILEALFQVRVRMCALTHDHRPRKRVAIVEARYRQMLVKV